MKPARILLATLIVILVAAGPLWADHLPPVDPLQVDVPDDWLDFPAYRVDADTVFSVTEKSRGIVSAVKLVVVRWAE